MSKNFSFKQVQDKDIVKTQKDVVALKADYMQSKYEIVNVKALGAKGDGITDDTAIIAYALANYNRIYFPAGSYVISSTLVLDKENMEIFGDGKQYTLFKPTFTTGSIFTINKDYSYFHDLGLHYISTTTKTVIGLYFLTGYFTVERVRMNRVGTGIQVNTLTSDTTLFVGRIADCIIWNFSDSGIILTQCADIQISNTFITGKNSNTSGLKLRKKCEAIRCNSASFLECTYGLYTTTDDVVTGKLPAFCVFVNCYFDSNTSQGAYIYRTRSLKFINCWFSNRPGVGAYLRECRDISFLNCMFIFGGNNAITLNPDTKHVKVIGCSIINNTGWAIYAIAGIGHFTITDCTIGNLYDDGGGGLPYYATQTHGIVVAAGSADYYIIRNNTFEGNTTAGLQDGGTGTHKIVNDNLTVS